MYQIIDKFVIIAIPQYFIEPQNDKNKISKHNLQFKICI